MAFPFFISMLDPFWTITTDEAELATRLRPPKEDADEVAVQASTEQRAMAAAKIRKREEEVYIVYKGFIIEIGGLFQLCQRSFVSNQRRVAVVEMRMIERNTACVSRNTRR